MKPAGYLIGASTCAGPYKIANCLIEERMVYTNKIPAATCARRAIRKAFSPTKASSISSRASSAWIRRSSNAKTCCATATDADRRPYLAHPRPGGAGKSDPTCRLRQSEAEKCRARSVIFRVEPERRRRQRVRDHRRRRQGQSYHTGGRPGRRRAHRDRPKWSARNCKFRPMRSS